MLGDKLAEGPARPCEGTCNMAQTTKIIQRVERDLDAIHSFVDDLPNLMEEWETLEEWDRVSTSLDWSHMMADYLSELEEYYNASHLTNKQRSSYRELLCKLQEVMPIIEKLNWYRPPVSLEVT